MYPATNPPVRTLHRPDLPSRRVMHSAPNRPHGRDAPSPARWRRPAALPSAALRAPGDLTDRLLPAPEAIPAAFWKGRHPLARTALRLPFRGTQDLAPFRDGIDPEAALRHLQAAMRCTAARFEHRVAGTAYLLSLWTKPDEPTASTP